MCVYRGAQESSHCPFCSSKESTIIETECFCSISNISLASLQQCLVSTHTNAYAQKLTALYTTVGHIRYTDADTIAVGWTRISSKSLWWWCACVQYRERYSLHCIQVVSTICRLWTITKYEYTKNIRWTTHWVLHIMLSPLMLLCCLFLHLIVEILWHKHNARAPHSWFAHALDVK